MSNRITLRIFAFLSLPAIFLLMSQAVVWAAIMRPNSLLEWVFAIALCGAIPISLCVEVILQSRKP